MRNEGEALVYLIDCTLATVCGMALNKRRPAGEFRRQISIAQKGLDWAIAFRVPLSSRPKDVVEKFRGSVNEWAHDFIERKKVSP